jgi:hypothetical protein
MIPPVDGALELANVEVAAADGAPPRGFALFNPTVFVEFMPPRFGTEPLPVELVWEFIFPASADELSAATNALKVMANLEASEFFRGTT